jgi:TM2 domain-containing membrane protein YozV
MTEADNENRSPVLALVLAWIIPGAGHAYAGRWGKAILFASLIVGLLIAGFILGGGTNLVWGELWYFAQACAGGPALALTPVSQYLASRQGIDWNDPLREMGTLYTAVAGFLNLLVMMDAYIRLAYPQEATAKEAA